MKDKQQKYQRLHKTDGGTLEKH